MIAGRDAKQACFLWAALDGRCLPKHAIVFAYTQHDAVFSNARGTIDARRRRCARHPFMALFASNFAIAGASRILGAERFPRRFQGLRRA